MKTILGVPLPFLIAVALVAVGGLPSGYYVITPGGAYPVEPRIEVPAEYRREMGDLAYTAVYAEPGTWGEVAWTRLSRSGELAPAEEVKPADMSEEEYNAINQRLIEESKLVAAVVGLRAAGYEVRVTGQGAEVVGLLENLPAAAVLREGDIVVAVDGQPVETATDLVEGIRRHEVGDEVRLTIVRDGQSQDVTVGTKASPTEPGRPLIGASISTRLFDVALPFPVEIDTDNVGGSSAGLIFSLGILDAVTDGLLTRGHAVAGTGTINQDGTVGPIGGAAQKVVAAERAGADLFLVPRENFDEARRAASRVRVVPVERFEEALRALCGLESIGSGTETPLPCAA
jgi:PDZ domain-containing protein